MSERSTVLRINGQDREVRGAANLTLLEALRDQLSLTGAKRGCNQGVCGACTVLDEGRPVRACLSLAANCAGRELQTIEGMQDDPSMLRLQASMVETGALQCGFCTPGMRLAARALLRAQPSPSIDEIREGRAGNLCRCSGYRKIVQSVERAARPR